MERSRTLDDVIRVLETLDQEYFKKQKDHGNIGEWNEADRLQRIREGIKHSIKAVRRMRNHKLEVM